MALPSLCPAALCCTVLLAGLATRAAAADFGSPPSGEIPILYNDRTVYAKPDILKKSRVLAAIERNGHVYVPLRSMLEQMGATVTISTGRSGLVLDLVIVDLVSVLR